MSRDLFAGIPDRQDIFHDTLMKIWYKLGGNPGTGSGAAPVQLAAGTAAIGTVSISQDTPGTTNAVQERQSSAVPSSFSVATATGTVFTLAAGERGFIQNLDDATLHVKLGASASTSSFNFLLKASAAADDGSGGYISIENWIGAVSVAPGTGTARYVAWKI